VNARTYVIDFPVSSHAKVTKSDLTIHDQLETYFTYQRVYVDHNCSNTVSVKPEEWDQLPQLIYDRWDDYLGITFLPLDGGQYQLMPYEACTEQEYQRLKELMQPLDLQLLQQFDQQLHADESEGQCIEIQIDETHKSECAGGACPLR
jgi:ribonucleoside-diphosphate reductase alpha chain/ribonucleoside-triphosphate reductase